MKVCLRTHMVSEDPQERIRYARDVGITTLQETAKAIPTAVDRGWPTAEELRAYRAPFDDASLEIIGLEPVLEPDPLWTVDSAEGRASFDRFARHLEAAGGAGISTVTLHPPLDDAADDEERKRQFEANCAFYERACAVARDTGTRLATHSPWPTEVGLWGASDFMSVFDAVPAPQNGMIFCFGCMALSRSDVHAAMDRLIDRIFLVHVRDVVIHDDSGRPVRDYSTVDEVYPGSGQVRPDILIRALAERGYDGPIAPEHLPVAFGERNHEISLAYAVGYCAAVLASLD